VTFFTTPHVSSRGLLMSAVGAIRGVLRRIRDRFDARGRRLRHLACRVRELQRRSKEQRAGWKRDVARLKRAGALRHRRILSPAVVHDLLPLRARTIGARAHQASAARRDEWFQEVSTAYRDALRNASQPHPDLVRTTVQGLTWWVPVPPSLRGKARERLIAKQRFPYRSITQTREFSVGSILLDIGANTGRMSIPRVILGDIAHACCAEPDPLNFAALVRNIASNGLGGLVLADQVAIGASCGPGRLQHAKYPGAHRLVAAEQLRDTIEVPCWSLDAWCHRLAIDLDLVTYVKVDTQGSEVRVLQGAQRLLERPHIAWQLEVAPAWLDAAGNSASELYDLCAARFSHFLDLAKALNGPRVRPVRELPRALAYLRGNDTTDIVLFNAAGQRLGRQ
jgi:FkbM family methyltransferase